MKIKNIDNYAYGVVYRKQIVNMVRVISPAGGVIGLLTARHYGQVQLPCKSVYAVVRIHVFFLNLARIQYYQPDMDH
jgi:hypothetical protein